MQRVLNTARLLLRPATLDDIDALWALWTNPSVRKYLWDDREISREEAATTLAECLELGAQGLGLWLLESAIPPSPTSSSKESLLGCAGLLPTSTAAEYDPRVAGMVEPLVALAPRVWGRGYAVEALAELLRYAVSELGLAQLAGITDVPNAASDRMLQRAGFRVLGEVPGPRYQLRTYLYEPPTDRAHQTEPLDKPGARAPFEATAEAPVKSRIHHLAVWVNNIDVVCSFYAEYFAADVGPLYENKTKGFSSRFLSFEGGTKIEVMASTTMNLESQHPGSQRLGSTHVAISLGSEQAVDTLARRLRQQGVPVIDGPRRTGDGYYECVVLDPEGNRIEVTA